MSEPVEDATRKQAIARLVSQGKMTHEHPGQYVDDDVDEASRGAIPEYDVASIREAMPDILQIDFDENDADGCWAVLEDGKSGESTKIMLGKDPPETTDGLIEVVQMHYRNQLGLEDMDDTDAALAAFDKI